jgi:hypothetical protein
MFEKKNASRTRPNARILFITVLEIVYATETRAYVEDHNGRPAVIREPCPAVI